MADKAFDPEARAAYEALRAQLGDDALEGIDIADLESGRDTDFGHLEMTDHGITLNLADMPAETGTDAADADTDEPAPTLAPEGDHPDFDKVVAKLDARAAANDPNPSLDRIAMLMDLLGTPQQSFNVIHVAGTNGKTSTARMAESILRALNRRTGLFTSPELERVTECILIGGEEISQTRFVDVWRDIEPYVDMVDAHFRERGEAEMSRFELLVGIAYAAFADAPVDVAIVEVGMGGTWDATNVVEADVSVITPIGIDHQRFLGETIEEIAAHKAGIIKARERDGYGPAENIAIVAEQEPEAMQVILERAVETGAAVARQGRDFTIDDSSVAVGGQQLSLQGLGGVYDDIFLPLSGAHQAENASVALAAVESFFGVSREHPLDMDSVRQGFAEVKVPARVERVLGDPVVLIDAAHNPHGAATLAEAMQRDFNYQSVIGVVSIFADKDARAMLAALEPVLADVVITQNTDPRAMDAYELAEIAYEVFGDERVRVDDNLPSAIELAIELAEEEGPEGVGVLITGSVATAGQARTYLRSSRGVQ